MSITTGVASAVAKTFLPLDLGADHMLFRNFVWLLLGGWSPSWGMPPLTPSEKERSPARSCVARRSSCWFRDNHRSELGKTEVATYQVSTKLQPVRDSPSSHKTPAWPHHSQLSRSNSQLSGEHGQSPILPLTRITGSHKVSSPDSVFPRKSTTSKHPKCKPQADQSLKLC